MGKRYKSFNKKIDKNKVAKLILFIIVIIGLGLIANEYYNRTLDAKLVNSQITVEEQMLEKDKTIEDESGVSKHTDNRKERNHQKNNSEFSRRGRNKLPGWKGPLSSYTVGGGDPHEHLSPWRPRTQGQWKEDSGRTFERNKMVS